MVRYSITMCRTVSADPGDLAGIFVERHGATHKLANAGLAPDLQAKVPGQSGDGRVGDIFWTCRTDDGPWQGYMIRERQCINSCSPKNTLQLTNAPNLVVWQWYGRIQDHPADFQFNGNPVLLGRADLGDCHTPGG